jgi:predicted amidohydrolase
VSAQVRAGGVGTSAQAPEIRPSLTVAAAQPLCSSRDVAANALAHARLIRAAHARVLVFPELSLTGYELDAEPVDADQPELLPIVRACAETETVALVGAPIGGRDGRPHIAMLRVMPDGVDVAYRKCHLGGEEAARFAPGDGPAAVVVDGWRIGLGICRDTGAEQHVRATAALDIDLYAAGLVHDHTELGMQEDRAVRIARTCEAHVVLASFAGPTGGGFERTAGVSSIWTADGTAVARAGREPGEFVRAALGRAGDYATTVSARGRIE